MIKAPKIAALIALAACNDNDCYPNLNAPNYTNYTVSPSLTQGLLIDDPSHQLDISKLQSKISAVQLCVSRLYLTEAQQSEGQCYGRSSGKLESCLVVKVAPDWRISPCTGSEVFPCNVPFASCAAKGQTPNSCPCSCRAIIQDQGIIVTTPNLELFPGQLTTVLTGCFNPWVFPLNECANPDIGDK